MPTKTLSASLDPTLYQRTRRAAREEGRKQSAVVAEALSLYTALPATVRQLLRELGLSETPEIAQQLAAHLQAAVLELRWQLLLKRIRAAMSPAARRRLESMTAQERDAVAAEAVRATRPAN